MANIIEEKSFAFAIRIVNLYKHLNEAKKEFVLSKQLLRSGTSIGANVAEAEQAQSTPDFVSKMSIALKEASETKYWIRLLASTSYLTEADLPTDFDTAVNAAYEYSTGDDGERYFELVTPISIGGQKLTKVVSRVQYNTKLNRARVVGVTAE